MERKESVKYLLKKDRKVTDKEIEKVMKEGKIYGDPLVEVEW